MSTHMAVIVRTQYGQHYARCSCGHVGQVANTVAEAEHHHRHHERFAPEEAPMIQIPVDSPHWRLAA